VVELPRAFGPGSSNYNVEYPVPIKGSRARNTVVRPDGFEPPTPWFEEPYSKHRKLLENKAFWHFSCATESSVIPTYALEIIDTVPFYSTATRTHLSIFRRKFRTNCLRRPDPLTIGGQYPGTDDDLWRQAATAYFVFGENSSRLVMCRF
jgi:hypothetical protein